MKNLKNTLLQNPLRTKMAVLFFGLTLTYSCNNESMMPVVKKTEEKVVIANRNNSSVSFVDVTTDKITKTLSIPNSEPMYVVYVPKTDKIYVGDRAGKKIHVVNPQNQEIEQSINVGNGVFHMWADGNGKELWVVNDVDNTISVVSLSTNMVTNTIDVGMKPHDIFLTKDGSTAFISVFTGEPSSDKIYKYSTNTYSKTGEANVGKEPHLFHMTNNRLYVPCQSGQLHILDGSTLAPISEKNYSGAHGIFTSPDQKFVFASNITGNQLYSINSGTGDQAQNPVNTVDDTPHNIVLNSTGNKMFVTHSGATASTVSVYSVNESGVISPLSSITAGINPFGLTYYKREF